MIHRLAVALVTVAAAFAATARCADADDTETAAAAALQKGYAYLLGKQSADGGWHSETYGSLRQGAATTALVLYAAGHVPAKHRDGDRARFEKGLAFLRVGIEKKGCVANTDGSLDYPTYGSALLLVAGDRLGLKIRADDRRRLIDFILQAQLVERRGFDAESPHYGGWDLMGASDLRGATSGTNVSITSIALESLALEDSAAAQAARSAARSWTLGCQQVSGGDGFPFTPDPTSANNKAETDEDSKRPRAYGTATCDGLRCLIYSGVPQDDKRLQAAIEWIEAHENVDEVPGFADVDESVGWQEGLRYYYYMTLAKSLRYLPRKTFKSRRTALLAKLVSLQADDGRWQNDSARMREDDPLIATALAVTALSALLD